MYIVCDPECMFKHIYQFKIPYYLTCPNSIHSKKNMMPKVLYIESLQNEISKYGYLELIG